MGAASTHTMREPFIRASGTRINSMGMGWRLGRMEHDIKATTFTGRSRVKATSTGAMGRATSVISFRTTFREEVSTSGAMVASMKVFGS